MAIDLERRKFISALGGAAAALPLSAQTQQQRFRWWVFSASGRPMHARNLAAFRNGLNETGYLEGRNVTVEYHWLEGQYDRLPALWPILSVGKWL